MAILNSVLLLAKNEPLSIRIAVCLGACAFGVVLIYVGRQNIVTRQAEESGRRRVTNAALGGSNSYTGSKAVFVGWMRILSGIVVIVFGFVFLAYGAFLAP